MLAQGDVVVANTEIIANATEYHPAIRMCGEGRKLKILCVLGSSDQFDFRVEYANTVGVAKNISFSVRKNDIRLI